MKNLYDVLEVDSDVSQDEIRKAYLKMVKKYHPDMNKGNVEYAETKMKEINNAYYTLKDPVLRKKYDEEMDKEKTTSHSNQGSNNQEENFGKQGDFVKERKTQYYASLAQFTFKVLLSICIFLVVIHLQKLYILFFVFLFIFLKDKKMNRKTFFSIMMFGIIICCIIITSTQVFPNINNVKTYKHKKSEEVPVDYIKKNLYSEYFPLYFYLNYERKATLSKSDVYEFSVDGIPLDTINVSGIYKYGSIVSLGKHEIEIGMNDGKKIIKKINISSDMNSDNSPYIVIAHIYHGKTKIELNTFIFDKTEEIEKYNLKLTEIDYDVIGIGPFDEIMEKKGTK